MVGHLFKNDHGNNTGNNTDSDTALPVSLEWSHTALTMIHQGATTVPFLSLRGGKAWLQVAVSDSTAGFLSPPVV